MRRGRKSAAQTPAPKSERIYGSKKNPKGSASSKKTAKNISFSEKTIKSLQKKLKEFKKNRPNSKITLNDLKAVYRRGAGAYSSSHRPTITGGVPNSRNAWAMARVNKFLKKAAGEKVKAAYVQDDDLLENGGSIKSENQIICVNCGWEWNESDTTIEGKYICHKCGENNSEYYNEIPIEKLTEQGQFNKGGLIAPNGKKSNLTPEQYKLVRTAEFKAWFGDWENDPENASKVVDENGEPLVVYHGSRSDFNIFDLDKGGQSNTLAQVGFWFTPIKTFAKNFASNVWYGQNSSIKVYSIFLNIRNPKIYETSPEKKVVFSVVEGGKIIKDDLTITEAKYLAQELNDKRWLSSNDNDEYEVYTISSNYEMYPDSYEKFKIDIYKLAGQTEKDANIGGLGMALNNRKETLEKYRNKLKSENYDGIFILKTRFDKVEAGGFNNQYVALYPEQIKLADGTNTTFDGSNSDIRYADGGVAARGKKIVGGGDCYYVAGQFAMAENFSPLAPADIDFIGTPYVVHAEVKGQGHLEGIRYGHAWVEDDENVYDYSNRRELVIPKDFYYLIGDVKTDNPEKYRKYTFAEARRKMIENKHYGQWDLQVDFKKGGEVRDKGLQEILFMENGGMATDYNYKYNQFLMNNESVIEDLEDGGMLKTPKSFQEIQEMHGTNPDYLLEQLMKGISVEKEHTDSDEMAETIALHHLEERPDYYEILEKVEKGEPMVPEMEFENNYYLWIVDDKKQGQGYDFANIEEALKNADITNYPNKIMSVRNYCGQKLIGHEDIMLINSGKKQIADVMLEKGGEIPEIEEFLKNQKEEADAVLFSRKSKIVKYMICNSNIEYAEEQINMTENDLEKNVWQQTKMIWSETKEEVDDMIFMYGEGGQPHTCSCQKYSKGGLAYGNSHDKGGMPMTVKSTGQKIEIEGGEGVVNKRTMQSSKEVNLNGKKMTPCEAVSKLNEMGGGVKFKCPDVKEIISKDGNF